MGHGADAGLDEALLLVVGHDPDTFGEDRIDLLESLLDGADDSRGVGAEELDHLGGNDLADAVPGLHAAANRAADLDVRELSDEHRRSVDGLDDDSFEIGDAGGETHRSHHKLLGVALDELGADVEVVGANRVQDLRQGDVVSQQSVRLHHDLELFLPAADPEDLGDAGHGLEVELDQPVLDRAQLLERVRSGGVLEVVEEDQTHSGRDRPHLRIAEALGDLLARLLQALADELASEVDVDVILEVDVDHGEAEVGDRADVVDAGQPGHGDLDREGDVLLDLLGRQALGHREDLHQIGRHVRERVDRKLPVAEKAGGHHQHRQDQDQETVR